MVASKSNPYTCRAPDTEPRRGTQGGKSRRNLRMEIRLDGKSAVITGGSKGLGLAMAEKFASSGANVAILARNPETLAEAKRQIQAGATGKVATVSTDVSKAADIRRAYDSVMS